MAIVYGSSDDLVEIENSKFEEAEIFCFGQNVRMCFDDGTVILIGYSRYVPGVWSIDFEKHGFASFDLSICHSEEANPYSDVLIINADVCSYQKINHTAY